MALLAKFNKLNRRERYIIMVGAGIAIIFLVAQFIVEPIMDRTKRKTRMLQTKTIMMEQMRQWQAEYNALTQKANVSKSRFRNRQKGFTLF